MAVAHGVEVWDIPAVRLRKALRAANRLLAVSTYTRARMAAALHISAEAISLLPDTFDQEKFQIGPKPQFLLARYGLEPDQPVIFTLARLEVAEQYKGYDQVLWALPQVRAAIPNIRYILGGSGGDRFRIESLVGELNLTDAVVLAGYISNDELCGHYNLCDLFVMPSKGEGFGIVFLEALSCGKPVIAGNQDASGEALLNGRLGVLVNPDKPTEIAEAIVRVLTRLNPASILHQPEKLRNEVTYAYGYSRFVKRLGEIVGDGEIQIGNR
jgi:glycosyltransferase involved in cell wall biosynthesis